jgi:predicted  nucleic acid-binding Zn-ribbon protein
MSTFQLIIIALAFVYVVSSLYFSISGRILARKREKKEDERCEKQLDFEDQIKVLTQRLGAITTENDRLNGVVRSWMAQANDYKIRLDAALKEKEEWEKEANDLQEQLKKTKKNSKKGGE